MNYQAQVMIRDQGKGQYQAYVKKGTETGDPQKWELDDGDSITLTVVPPTGATATFNYVNISDHKHNTGEGAPIIPYMRSDNRRNMDGTPAGAPGWWGGVESLVKVECEKPRGSNNWVEIYQISPGEPRNAQCVIKDTETEADRADDHYWFWGAVKLTAADKSQHDLIFDPEMVNKGTGN